MTWQEAGIVLSIFFTIPCIASNGLAIAKCVIVRAQLTNALGVDDRLRQAMGLLILAEIIGAIGSIGDQTWWGIAWTEKFRNNPFWVFWFENGVFPNIPFRQICSLVKSYLLIKGLFRLIDRPLKYYQPIMRIAWLVSTVVAFYLIWSSK